MLTIALTSIPPRFPDLANVTEQLLAQTIPARVVVSIPQTYRRFPGTIDVPGLPSGVIVLRPTKDYGPATKLLGCLKDPEATDILYCDDDWDYMPHWAARFLAARKNTSIAVAASTFPIERLKRTSTSFFDKIAQGFGGVLVHKDMFDARVFDLPRAAYAADDVWLSACLAANAVEIITAPEARKSCAPRNVAGPQLQTSRVARMTRAEANMACMDAVFDRFGLWPGK